MIGIGNPPRTLRFGAGGHDHVIGFLLVDEAGPHTGAGDDLDSESTALVDLIANHVAELGAVGDRCGEAYLTTDLVVLFVHRDAMTIARGGDGGLKTGRPTSHDHDVLGLGGERHVIVDGPFVFATGARILDAAEPAVETHAAHALLIARQTESDLVGGTGASLGREVGIGDLTPHHAHEIAMTFGERTLGLQRILETPDSHHR